MSCSIRTLSLCLLVPLVGALTACGSDPVAVGDPDVAISLEIARVVLDPTLGHVSERDDCTACVIYPGTYLELYVRHTNTTDDWMTIEVPDDCVDTDPATGGSILVDPATGLDTQIACDSASYRTVDLAPYGETGFYGYDYFSDQEVAWIHIPFAEIDSGEHGFGWGQSLHFRYADSERALNLVEGDFDDWL